MRQNKFQQKYCKIVLTGAPGAGKTTALQLLAEHINQQYSKTWRIFTVAEASSFLYQGGLQRCEMSNTQIRQWQEDILKTIMQLESVYDHIAQLEKDRNVLIICDRGCLDPKVFTEESHWTEILKKFQCTKNDLLNRYDCVIQLHTAPSEFYNVVDNLYRRENYQESKEINQKYEDVWKKHPNFFVVQNNQNLSNKEDSWKEKYENILKIVNKTVKNWN